MCLVRIWIDCDASLSQFVHCWCCCCCCCCCHGALPNNGTGVQRTGIGGGKAPVEIMLPCYQVPVTLYDGVYHTPLDRFPKLDCSATKRVPMPNDTSSESSRRDVFNGDLYGTGGTVPTVTTTVEISTMENRPRGVIYANHSTI